MDWIATYWIQAAFGGMIAALGIVAKVLTNRIKAQAKEHAALKGGMKGLIRVRLTETYYKRLERGYCPFYVLDNMNTLYAEYKALGGNGAMDAIMEKAKALPTQKPPEGS